MRIDLRDRPTADIDTRAIARRTEGWTGADLRALCETATEFALEESVRSGSAQPIGPRHVDTALAELRPYRPPKGKSPRFHVSLTILPPATPSVSPALRDSLR